MLTDEEKSGIIKQYTFGPDINALALVSEVERAVLAKAMPITKQEPAYYARETGGAVSAGIRECGTEFEKQLYCIPLYTDPQPAQAAAIPDKIKPATRTLESIGYANGWNDCREAMLSAFQSQNR